MHIGQCAANVFYKSTIIFTPRKLYTSYKLRNNIVQLDLVDCKPQECNQTIKYKNILHNYKPTVIKSEIAQLLPGQQPFNYSLYIKRSR